MSYSAAKASSRSPNRYERFEQLYPRRRAPERHAPARKFCCRTNAPAIGGDRMRLPRPGRANDAWGRFDTTAGVPFCAGTTKAAEIASCQLAVTLPPPRPTNTTECGGPAFRFLRIKGLCTTGSSIGKTKSYIQNLALDFSSNLLPAHRLSIPGPKPYETWLRKRKLPQNRRVIIKAYKTLALLFSVAMLAIVCENSNPVDVKLFRQSSNDADGQSSRPLQTGVKKVHFNARFDFDGSPAAIDTA